jgi:hypothetical protein
MIGQSCEHVGEPRLRINYTLSNSGGKQAKTAPAKEKRTIKAAACPICDFQTAPPHDGRTHRNQKKKTRFSRRN